MGKGHITLARKVADSKQNRAAVNSVNIGKKGEPTIGSAFPLFKVELRWLKKKALDDEGKEVPTDMKEFESAKWFASVFPEFLKDTSILIVFQFGRLPFWSSSILVVFHFGHLPFWSSSILVVF